MTERLSHEDGKKAVQLNSLNYLEVRHLQLLARNC